MDGSIEKYGLRARYEARVAAQRQRLTCRKRSEMVRVGQPFFGALALGVIALMAASGGCGGGKGGSGFDDSTSSSGGDGQDSSVSSGGSSSGFSVTGTDADLGSGSSGAAPACSNGTTGWKCSVDTS